MPIVAGVDRSDRASAVVEKGHELAERYDTSLHIVHVAKLVEATAHDDVGGPILEIDRARDDAMQVSRAAARMLGDDSRVITVGLVGDTAHELVKYSDEHNAEYIIVSCRKRSVFGKMVFGSVTESLLMHSSRPIISVMANDDSR